MKNLNNSFKISIFSDGFIFGENVEIPLTCRVCNHDLNSKRGAVSKFSSKSARRLREFLLRYIVEGKDIKRLAITYTLPVNVSVDCWYSIIKRWRQNLIRSNLACVWRVELQKRGVPHLHVVGYARGLHDCGAYWSAWVCAVDSVNEPSGLPVASHDGFLIYGCVMRWIFGSRWYAYLAAHIVKHKNDQLGWRGRQWGIVNRALFSSVRHLDFEMSPWVATRIARVVRRRFSYKGFTRDAFGTRCFFGLQNLSDLIAYYEMCQNERIDF